MIDCATVVRHKRLRTGGAVVAGGLPASQYAEVASAAATYNSAFNAAIAEMADAQERVVFVAGSADGWLFWSTDADRTTIEESARLVGLNSVTAFAREDLI